MDTVEKIRVLNLGCGFKTINENYAVNIDCSIHFWIRRSPFKNLIYNLIGKERAKKIKNLPSNILVYNLKKGIPFEDNSVDFIYHSHLLEHIDRDLIQDFFTEKRRVLKTGAILRIAIPDFEFLCHRYLKNVRKTERQPSEVNIRYQDKLIASIIEQSTRKESSGSSQQPIWRRKLENLILGDARVRGETHQWMYDRHTLSQLLLDNGFKNPIVKKYNSSKLDLFSQWRLELDDFGKEYKPGSLYIECNK